MESRAYRAAQLRNLTDKTGVYALCDLDGVPIYVGQSTDGIRSRVRRHLTSARSDIIANRQIDVWEIAFVWAWEVPEEAEIARIEACLFSEFDSRSRLMNGKTMLAPVSAPDQLPPRQVVQIIAEEERLDRLDPAKRLPRQIAHYLALVDYMLIVKDEAHLRRSLDAHFARLVKYHETFLS